MRDNRLKKTLREGKPALGIWSGIGDPVVVEALAETGTSLGLDWLLIDCEHGAPTWDRCIPLLQAMKDTEPTSLVRIPKADRSSIARVLDAGAEGVLIPQVRTADEVRELVAAAKYPPTGTRGIGPYRATRFYNDAVDYFARANDELFMSVQIETLDAVENLDEILAVVGLDAVLIGPADMSAALGHFLDQRHEECEAVFRQILEACQRHDVPAGFFCESGKAAKARIDQGFRFVNVGTDFGTVSAGLVRNVEAARA